MKGVHGLEMAQHGTPWLWRSSIATFQLFCCFHNLVPMWKSWRFLFALWTQHGNPNSEDVKSGVLKKNHAKNMILIHHLAVPFNLSSQRISDLVCPKTSTRSGATEKNTDGFPIGPGFQQNLNVPTSGTMVVWVPVVWDSNWNTVPLRLPNPKIHFRASFRNPNQRALNQQFTNWALKQFF